MDGTGSRRPGAQRRGAPVRAGELLYLWVRFAAPGEGWADGGRLLLQCFAHEGGRVEAAGPRLFSRAAIREAFSSGWSIDAIRPVEYPSARKSFPAWLVLATRGL